jgi:ABC-type nitrate/sulfonate/bicarbonate transport system permease component
MKSSGSRLGVFIALGAAFGTALGASMHNVGVGLALGVAIGTAIGAAVNNRR